MTPESSASYNPAVGDDDTDLFELGATMLRWRWRILFVIAVGGVLGLAIGLMRPRVYTSRTTFIPQGAESQGASGLAAAASQFGLRIATPLAGWGPSVYVELLGSRGLLGPVAMDTVVIAEENGRRAVVADLLEVPPGAPGVREEGAARALAKVVHASEAKPLGGVMLSVSTRWPSVSFAIAQRLLASVNEFNVKTRKSQAGAERVFVEQQAAKADAELRDAERQQLDFLERNRVIGSSALTTERDRLQRMVSLRTQVYTSLLQNLEDAKMREVRDTPVITVIEEPRLAVMADRRGSVTKAAIGALLGSVIGVLFAIAAQALKSARRVQTPEAREFFREASQAIPGFLRKSSTR